MADPIDDFLSGFGLPRIPTAAKIPPKKKEKGVPWTAKVINGKYYVPLEQVVELLKQNDALPAVRRGIEDRIALLETQKHLDI